MEMIGIKEETKFSVFLRNNMSLLTNLAAAAVFALSSISPFWSHELRSIGLFALSGSLTNWIAVHMLFEKVPGFYGSGVILVKFKAFKEAIYKLIMTEFFSHEHLKAFFSEEGEGQQLIGEEIQIFLDKLDYDVLYGKVLDSLLRSPVGPMLSMVGGEKILEPAKPYVIEAMKQKVHELADKAAHDETLQKSVEKLFSSENLKPKIERVILGRLDELTPFRVKEIVEEIIKEHLGWLVVWGAVFGGLIGLVASFL